MFKKLSIQTLFLGLMFLLQTAYAQENIENIDQAKITFEESTHDFGEITQGDKVEHVFNFKNTGKSPLVITNVRTTCGCTAPEWPREAILPGDESSIKVVFNSRGKMGMQNKTITITSNASNSPERIKIVGNVVKSAEQ